MRSFRDRDCLITPEGFIFTVIGNLHPADRVIAYLKYVPDEQGKWGTGHSRYRRALATYNVLSVMDSMRFLSQEAPQYIFESAVEGISLPAVPKDRIASHLFPETRLLELQSAKSRDELESKATKLTQVLSKGAGVQIESLGLTGSILARIHNPRFSDIDLVVYGFANALRVKTFLHTPENSPSREIRKLTGTSREKWISERLRSTPLTRQDAVALLARKWNIGSFEGTDFSIHAVHTEMEVHGEYGDDRYKPLGIIDATARIASAEESMFMPAVYQIEQPEMKGSPAVRGLDRIVSYEGLYADVAVEGETVSCRGKLERVESSSGVSHRILIGSPEAGGTDYLLPLAS